VVAEAGHVVRELSGDQRLSGRVIEALPAVRAQIELPQQIARAGLLRHRPDRDRAEAVLPGAVSEARGASPKGLASVESQAAGHVDREIVRPDDVRAL